MRDAFSFSATEIFLVYHEKQRRNEYLQWRVDKKEKVDLLPLTDDEFVERYGPPPWELLDATLEAVGLQYQFVPPAGPEEDLGYEAKLRHIPTGTTVSADHLSSGEKTLLAIALSLYSGVHLGDSIEVPRVLLLDEADASLHPSMVTSLLRVVEDLFCEQYGVGVILTTHSPSTVALAPEGSLFVMDRLGSPRLRKASRDEALKGLTFGIPTLSVRNEHRRQVFVESEVDQACYQALFTLLQPRLPGDFALEFIASGKGGAGNAAAVIHLVGALRGTGNDSVWGIVDRDQREGTPAGIEFVPSRYAIENLLLDPVPIAIQLLRDRAVAPEAMGLPTDLRHYELSGDYIQVAADYVSNRVFPGSSARTTVHYVDGASITLPSEYVDMRGHDVESRLIEAFPQLKRHRRLMLTVVQNSLADTPGLAPRDAETLFLRLLA